MVTHHDFTYEWELIMVQYVENPINHGFLSKMDWMVYVQNKW